MDVPPLTCNVFLVSSMFVFVVMTVIAAVTNGANICPEPDDGGEVDCENQGVTTIPRFPERTILM